MEELLKYSNPKIAQANAYKYLGKDALLYRSSRKDKKYMVINPEGKKVHFGQMFYEDFTKHGDLKRRDLFRLRNSRWKTADKWTPAYLSYYILW